MDITARIISYHGDGVHFVEEYQATAQVGVYHSVGNYYSVISSEELTIGEFYDMRLSDNPQPIDYRVFGAIKRSL